MGFYSREDEMDEMNIGLKDICGSRSRSLVQLDPNMISTRKYISHVLSARLNPEYQKVPIRSWMNGSIWVSPTPNLPKHASTSSNPIFDHWSNNKFSIFAFLHPNNFSLFSTCSRCHLSLSRCHFTSSTRSHKWQISISTTFKFQDATNTTVLYTHLSASKVKT